MARFKRAYPGRLYIRQGPSPAAPTSGPVFEQATQAVRAPAVPVGARRGGLIYGSTAPGGDASSGTGRVLWSPGAPVQNPVPSGTMEQQAPHLAPIVRRRAWVGGSTGPYGGIAAPAPQTRAAGFPAGHAGLPRRESPSGDSMPASSTGPRRPPVTCPPGWPDGVAVIATLAPHVRYHQAGVKGPAQASAVTPGETVTLVVYNNRVIAIRIAAQGAAPAATATSAQ